MVSTSRAKPTLLVVLLSFDSAVGTRTGSRPARAAVAAKDLITTVATRSSFFSFLGLERGLRCRFSGVASALSLAVPSVLLSVLGLGSGVLDLLAGAALRRCANVHPFPLVHAPLGKYRQGAGWSYSHVSFVLRHSPRR